MKIQHFENNPEIQFDIDLIARIVHAITKAVTVNIPQQLHDQHLETNNYIALTGNDLWTAPATADPFKALKLAKDKVQEQTGTTVAYAVMNSYTFNLMGGADAVKNRWLTTTGRSMGYLTDAEIKQVINGTSNIAPVIYDKQYRDESLWLRKAITNVAMSGFFSSDRTINEYNDKIWNLKKLGK